MMFKCGLVYFLLKHPKLFSEDSKNKYDSLVFVLETNTSMFKSFSFSFSSSLEVEKTIDISIESSIKTIIVGAKMMPKNNTVKKIDTAFFNIFLFD